MKIAILIGVLGLAIAFSQAQPAVDREKFPALLFALEASPDLDGGGLVMAAWSDGVVVYAAAGHRPGKELKAGTIDEAALARVSDGLRMSGIFETDAGWVAPPGLPSHVLLAHFGGRSVYRVCSWDDGRFGQADASVQSNPEEIAFARAWALSRVAIAYARPKSGVPLRSHQTAAERLDAAVAAKVLIGATRSLTPEEERPKP